MRSLLKIFLLLFSPVFVIVQFQHNQLDSMHRVLQHAANSTIRMDAYTKPCIYYDDINLDCFVYYSEHGIAIARQLGLKLNEAEMLMNIVSDNGNGIPQNIVDKIFQPFFTTKPTGQGTGLGLSLSYDIIKAHGGEIKVETKEGEGSEFIIQLPLS